jgi:two-component system, cell cycle response regulator
MSSDEINEVLKEIDIIKYVYDVIRIVDPVKKEVVSYKHNEMKSTLTRCYDFWAKDKICNNCISIRAFNENNVHVKIEYNAEDNYMVMAIPYVLKGRKIVIELLKDITDHFILDTGETTGSMKSDIYMLVENMNRLLLKDTLTEVYNRRYISEKLPVDMISSKLSNQEISIIMMDIDFLKNVNDDHGHVAGDLVIKGCASIIHKCLDRKNDWIARYGGEEFVVCLPGASINKAIAIAEKMRRMIEVTEFNYKEEVINITASFGILNIQPDQEIEIEEAIENVDKKLYSAKKNGRNRVAY